MKKVIVIFLMVLFPMILLAEDSTIYYWNKFSYDNFIMWMQSTEIPNFKLSQTEKEGSENAYNIEYSAMLADEHNNMLNVRIGNEDVFYQYEDLKSYEIDGPYDFDGFPSVFIYNKKLTKPSNLTYILIQLPDLKVTFSISALTKKRLNRQEMESYVKYFKLHSVGQSNMLLWPNEIAVPFRIPGEMLQLEKSEINSEEIEYEYHVKFAKSNHFLNSLKLFYKKNRGWLDLLTFMDFNLICKTSDSFDVLNKMKDGELIEFVYYKKKF